MRKPREAIPLVRETIALALATIALALETIGQALEGRAQAFGGVLIGCPPPATLRRQRPINPAGRPGSSRLIATVRLDDYQALWRLPSCCPSPTRHS